MPWMHPNVQRGFTYLNLGLKKKLEVKPDTSDRKVALFSNSCITAGSILCFLSFVFLHTSD